jgi:hypothetical protein
LKQPPRFATWLLSRFVSGAKGESLIGDLAERYQQGCSRRWYWQQAIVAVLVSCVRDARDHKLFAIRAVVTGIAIVWLCDFGTRTLSMWINLNARGAIWINGHWFQMGGWLLPTLWYVSLPMMGTVSGWIVGRAHGASMTLTFAGCFIVWQVIQLSWWWPIVAAAPNGFRLDLYVLFSLMVFAGIVLSGLVFATQRPSRLGSGY